LRRRIVGEGETVPVGALLGVVADSTVADAELDGFIASFQEEFAAHEAEAWMPRGSRRRT
jgi:pyruvate dehydrogenase E2 component (dihydrolipoamide acetyltransferase)